MMKLMLRMCDWQLVLVVRRMGMGVVAFVHADCGKSSKKSQIAARSSVEQWEP